MSSVFMRRPVHPVALRVPSTRAIHLLPSRGPIGTFSCMTWPPWHSPIGAISGWVNRKQRAADRQLDAATVVKALSPIGDVPANEA
jgi:hypothetical protein